MPRRPDPRASPSDTTAQRIVAGLSKVALVFRHAQWASSGHRGLTPTQAQILAIVAGHDGPRGLGVKAVARQLAVTTATASEAVTTLADKGLLRKDADNADGRAVVLRLTAAGKREAARGSEWPGAIVDAIERMPEGERAALLRGVVGMVRAMEDRKLVPTARMCVSCRFFRPNEYPGAARPHHCLFIEAPIGDAELRVDCTEMEPVEEGLRSRLWSVFVHGSPIDAMGPGAGSARAGADDTRAPNTVRTSSGGNES